MKQIYLTTYHIDDRKYSGWLYAESYSEALELAMMRGIGETPSETSEQGIGIQTASMMPVNTQKIHATTYLCWLGIKSGVISVDDALSDRGLLHELIHHLDIPEEPLNPSIEELNERIRNLEKRIPGVT